MNQDEIRTFLEAWKPRKEKTIVIVDFGNVEKWKQSLGWKIGIQELGDLVRHFTSGKEFLRRFYYGADYGPKESNKQMTQWSSEMLRRAKMNRFEVIQKRVKYIHDSERDSGYLPKCELDVEMVVDLIRERENYEHIILLSGDGDLVPALAYLREEFGKTSVVMSARGHIARETIDALAAGVISEILYAEDFEYRLRMGRFFR